MLDDTSRKLLRILVQFRYHFKRMPSLLELRRLSGRRPAEITKGFKVLAEENYIQWSPANPIETAEVIIEWERGVPYDKTSQQKAEVGHNMDYWLYH